MTCCIFSRPCCSTLVVASTDDEALDDSSLSDDAVSDVWRGASVDSGDEKASFSGSHGNIPTKNKVNDAERVDKVRMCSSHSAFISHQKLKLLHDDCITAYGRASIRTRICG